MKGSHTYARICSRIEVYTHRHPRWMTRLRGREGTSEQTANLAQTAWFVSVGGCSSISCSQQKPCDDHHVLNVRVSSSQQLGVGTVLMDWCCALLRVEPNMIGSSPSLNTAAAHSCFLLEAQCSTSQ